MPRTKAQKTATSTKLSSRTTKQIDSLPTHAQHIFKKVHANAIKEYQDPNKRRGGISETAEEVTA